MKDKEYEMAFLNDEDSDDAKNDMTVEDYPPDEEDDLIW